MDPLQATEPIPESQLDRQASIEVLLAEYQAMYRLAEFRMSSLERRVPATGAAIVAFLGVLPLLPDSSQWIVLMVVPASLVWMVRTTINHARSFEDALRRIEWIEKQANAIAGQELLGFQSNHPSRGVTVGGRTGVETVGSVLLAAVIVLLSCLALTSPLKDDPSLLGVAYYLYILGVAAHFIVCVKNWRRYLS